MKAPSGHTVRHLEVECSGKQGEEVSLTSDTGNPVKSVTRVSLM